MVTKETVMDALREVYDPEIPVNVVDLGLIYGVDIKEDNVHVQTTMTARGCPMHQFLSSSAEERILSLSGVKDAHVEIVWDPPWTPERITQEGRKALGWG